ncbi:hypothetical protein QBC46DRAFT_372108 [Diplogelasinospora grovesii]|uniref:Uncharacterized protein n=1 Tax=Diplogelasinospora grovesii TaxID=303347 RepID=A0AAN6NGL2_9PEZI|nr:hypothetical protein QBC46DRAFT_372108 [Diplogelasinospora grovesii]
MAEEGRNTGRRREELWRLVDQGEHHDSFDADEVADVPSPPNSVPAEDEDGFQEVEHPAYNGVTFSEEALEGAEDAAYQPRGSQPSGSGSQPNDFPGSQDESVQGFASRAERDEQVILRTPFAPSVPAVSWRDSTFEASNMPRRRLPTESLPAFAFPASGSRQAPLDGPAAGTRSQTKERRESETWNHVPRRVDRPRRGTGDTGSSGSSTQLNDRVLVPSFQRRQEIRQEDRREVERGAPVQTHSVGPILHSLLWCCSVVVYSALVLVQTTGAVVLRALRHPIPTLKLVAVIWACCGGLIVAKNMWTKGPGVGLSFSCRFPVVSSWRHCDWATYRSHAVFEDLLVTQAGFTKAGETSAQGARLPLEMLEATTSIRDLRTLIRESSLVQKNSFMPVLDDLIRVMEDGTTSLRHLNVNTGTAMDAVVVMNTWASGYLDGLAEEPTLTSPGGWKVFTLFKPVPAAVFAEEKVLDDYVRHLDNVAERIKYLIRTGHVVMKHLESAEAYLKTLETLTGMSGMALEKEKDKVLSVLYRFLGGGPDMERLGKQLATLNNVNSMRYKAADLVKTVLRELTGVMNSLQDLREQAVTPRLLKNADPRARVRQPPLSEHVARLNESLVQLAKAREKMRSEEDETMIQVNIGGKPKERLIGSV